MKYCLAAVACAYLIAGCHVYTPMQSSSTNAETASDAGASGAAAVGGKSGGSSASQSGASGVAGSADAGSGASAGGIRSGQQGQVGQVGRAGQLGTEIDRSCSGGECWWSGTTSSAECRTAAVPTEADRPPALDGDKPLPDLYFGWTRIWIGETDLTGNAANDAWQSFGFDLDGTCTNSKTCPDVQGVQSCRPATDQIPFDGALCRDNTFASLQPVAAAVPEIGKRFGISEAEFNCNLWRGSYTVMVKVSGYNGLANDSDVRTDVYISPGLVREQPWQCPQDNFATSYPLWRLANAFKVDPANLVSPATEEGKLPDSTVSDPHAYVREGYLVAKLPDGALVRLAADGTRYRGFALTMFKGLWATRLERAQDGRWHMFDGLAAGRVLTDDLIKSFRQIGLCHGVGLDGFYDSVVEYIQQNSDVLSDGTVDAARACDAMSFGIGFEGAQLTPGPVANATPIVECCEPGVAIEDCNPMCGDGRKNGKEKCDTAIASGQPGACPRECPKTDGCMKLALSGSGCDAECKGTPITAVGEADGCCPKGADATSDKDCAAVCGNGVIEVGETCDPVSSCGSCAVPDKCLKVTTTGSQEGCNIMCSYMPVSACVANDGCCPDGCDSKTDSDCSPTCGNNTVEINETCDGSADKACPASCDDKDPCTEDHTSGSAKNCSIRCTHMPVMQAKSGDSCCPPGASANTDSDCKATCGNMKVEQGEACDDGNQVSGDGCTPDCKAESPVEQCIAELKDDRLPECARCNCEKCQELVHSCYGSPKADENELCGKLVACGLEKKCSSQSCYCGTAPLATCILGVADGPCRGEVERAGGTSLPGDLLTRSNDPGYPLGRANALAACARDSCMTECGLGAN